MQTSYQTASNNSIAIGHMRQQLDKFMKEQEDKNRMVQERLNILDETIKRLKKNN